MKSAVPCPCCSGPRPVTANICKACAAGLVADLAAAPAVAAQLRLTLCRQTARPSAPSSGGQRSVLPYDERAGRLLAELRNLLVTWVRLIQRPVDRPEGPRCPSCAHWTCGLMDYADGPRDTEGDMARWLLRQHRMLLRHPAVEELAAELGEAISTAPKVYDLPPDRWYAGPCECGTDLYARPGAVMVACGCGNSYHIDTRRDELLARIVDRLENASQIAHILTLLVAPLKPATVWQWAARDRLVPRGTDPHGHRLYRVGDARDLLAASLARAHQRQQRRASAGRQPTTGAPAPTT